MKDVKECATFASRFRELCGVKEQNELAEKFGVTKNTFRQWTSGNATPTVEKLIKLSDYFGVSTDYLLGLSKTKSPDIKIQAAALRYGLTESTLEQLSDITARTAPNKLPGFIETSSVNIAASAILSAVNAILTNETGLAMLEKFDYAVSEATAANIAKEITADTSDRNFVKQQEYTELTQFKAWQSFNRAIETLSRLRK